MTEGAASTDVRVAIALVAVIVVCLAVGLWRLICGEGPPDDF